ncbi:heme o synthase [Deinococcus wulumuqiensis]|uniref:Protoheme IX farnesyltransferase n=1 Tax=Deinococcus wulumuqiensis TaxID=980427 RepID=A0AAV4K5D2_9DEIO|nr:heme o synthase [Deinococcus wulumuqiensis]QII21331.1 protoheme IX farnesyltransferase [Deinococcus wulumuqiensis R12]GGI78665.1 protoheme IX farnesyltransferase [Deinococcus wulumuqiensis]GGP30257.1 protoheme IX farnesyltransferase [Deinococcus wulumuqiensis]
MTSTPLSDSAPPTQHATWRDYLALTKPKVISLLLWTTLTAMFMAARGWPGETFGSGLWLLVVVSLAGYMSAGSAGVFNMIIDRDIDLKMARTAGRPTSSGLISGRNAAIFGTALQVLSFVMLWVWGTPLAAWMSLAGFVFYVVIYTQWLKRTTWHNIVIGGAAGCFPPLVGWAAVTGDLDLFAGYLFAIIFFWTPVHFWALALMIKEEYREVGIPMLPVVHGDHMTVAQIGLYAIYTVVLSLMPVYFGAVGWIYFVSGLLLGAWLLHLSYKLYRHVASGQPAERRVAVPLYLYSMLYLALLFLAGAIDRAVLV